MISAVTLADRLRRGELTPVQAVEESLETIERLNRHFPAFLTVDAEGALRRAHALSQGPPQGALWGVPVGIKDLALTAGLRSTSGCLDRSDFVPEMDSLSVERIQAAGGIVVGKTNTPEFGYKAITDNGLAPPLGNPWNRLRHAGGSSGGAAVAVALGMVALGEGTDGAGSIRVPASFCGVVGFKPTFGRVPRFPIPDQYNTLSHTGPIAASVEDAALLLDVLAGPDERDPLCLTDTPASALEAVRRSPALSHWRIGYSTDLGYARLDDSVAHAFQETLELLARQGAQLEECDPGHVDPEPMLLRLWNVSYASRFGADHEQRYPQLGAELRDITRAGFEPSSWSMGLDAHERSRLFACYTRYFRRFDLLLTPTLPISAFELSRQRPPAREDTLFGWTPFTYPYNLTGLPALTVPMGRDEAGLPLGLQVVGPRGADIAVLQAGRTIELMLEGRLGRPWLPDLKNL